MANVRMSTFSEIVSKFGPGETVDEANTDLNYNKFATLTDEKVPYGYYVLYVPNPNTEDSVPLEIGVVQKFYDSLSFLVSKEYSLGMKIKYQTDFEFLLEEVGAKQDKLNKKGIRRHNERKLKRQKAAQNDDSVQKKSKQ